MTDDELYAQIQGNIECTRAWHLQHSGMTAVDFSLAAERLVAAGRLRWTRRGTPDFLAFELTAVAMIWEMLARSKPAIGFGYDGLEHAEIDGKLLCGQTPMLGGETNSPWSKAESLAISVARDASTIGIPTPQLVCDTCRGLVKLTATAVAGDVWRG